jgi:cytochrome P450
VRTYQQLNPQQTATVPAWSAERPSREGPAPHRLLGWQPEKGRFWRDPVAYVSRMYELYGEVSALGLENPEWVFAFKPELNRQLLDNSELFHWAGRKMWKAEGSILGVLRTNVGNMDGPQYWTRQALMRPAFHNMLVKSFPGTIEKITREMLEGWREGEVRDVYADVQRLIHAIAMKVVIGVDDKPTVDRLLHLVRELYRTSLAKWTMLFPYDLPGTTYRGMVSTTKELIDVLGAVVAEKRAPDYVPTDMVGAMMMARTEDGSTWTDIELIGEAFNIMNHETTMSALTWTLIMIVKHPEIHAQLLDELSAVLHGEAPTAEQLQRLTLLDRVVKESLRLLPPQAVTRRFNSEPCQFGPYRLRKGTMIVLSAYLTHRLPDLYKEPRKFLPQRWETIKPTSHEYFPFGAGTHSCPGKVLATMNIKIIVAMMLQRFRLDFVPQMKIERQQRAGLLLCPKGSVPMKLSAQDGQFRPSQLDGNINQMVDFG